jgi:flagellar hook-length control protein FliK
MSTFIPPSLLASASPLPNAPQLSTRGTTARQQDSFSRQLEQSRQAHAQEGPRPAPQAQSPTRPATTPAAPAPRPPAKSESNARNEVARAARPPSPSRERAAAADGDSARTEAEPKADTGKDTDATDSAAGNLLAPLAPPPDATAPPPADDALAASSTVATQLALAQATQTGAAAIATDADGATADATGLAGTASAAGGASALPEALNLPGPAGARASREPSGADAREPGFWQQAQAAAVLADASAHQLETKDVNRAEPTVGLERNLDHPGLTGLSGPVGHAGKTAVGDVTTVNLATPATSAEFRAALGAQVSFFARAGVQQAELHLNPADMGPVSIQIVVDGQQAQVNFGADSALTRQIIESGMPELAGALRDAGLTLTGGGVSQHAGGGQRQDANGGGSPGDTASNGHSDTTSDLSARQVEQTRRSAVRISQGGVDLYA